MRIIQTDPDEGKHLVEISTEEAQILHFVVDNVPFLLWPRRHPDWEEQVSHLTDKLNRIIS